MLILTRRISESLIIGDKEIVITVLGIVGNQVRIGIDAHKGTQIDREEIYLRKKQQGEPHTAFAQSAVNSGKKTIERDLRVRY